MIFVTEMLNAADTTLTPHAPPQHLAKSRSACATPCNASNTNFRALFRIAADSHPERSTRRVLQHTSVGRAPSPMRKMQRRTPFRGARSVALRANRAGQRDSLGSGFQHAHQQLKSAAQSPHLQSEASEANQVKQSVSEAHHFLNLNS